MHSVLLQEEPVLTAVEENEKILVDVTVVITGKVVSFAGTTKEAEYTVGAQSIGLIGSDGGPREFLVSFTLSEESQKEGYSFANPGLKFFQGDSRHAGFRVNTEAGQVSVTVAFFNTLKTGDQGTSDEFSLLLLDPDGKIFPHDPTIVWDPPNG
jgi:hypothetical protein